MENMKVKIGGKTYTLQEMSVKQIKALFEMPDDSSIIDRLEYLYKFSATADIKDFYECTPSELKPLMDGLVEVNSPFFGQAEKVGMAAAAEVVKNLINSTSMIAFAASSEQDTAKKSGNTNGVSSLEH